MFWSKVAKTDVKNSWKDNMKNIELTDMLLLQGDTIQVIIGQVEKLELDLKDLKERLLNLEKQNKKAGKWKKLHD